MKTRMPRKFLSLLTVVALLFSLVVTTYAADSALTRGELAARLVEGAGLSDQVAAYASQPSAFQDVTDSNPYKGQINLAYAKGLVSGTGDGYFSPDEKTTQIEAVTVLLRSISVSNELLGSWPEGYATVAADMGLTEGFTYDGNSDLTADVFTQMLANAKTAAGKPMIGISWGGDPQDFIDIHEIVGEKGAVAVRMPQITSYNQAVSAVAAVDGIVVTGGQDINPDLYGEEHSPLLEDNDEERDIRDTSDYNLIKAALDKNVPTLHICRGMQMLNVVLGGGLIQDLPTFLGKDESYTIHRNRPEWARHDVTVERHSKWMYDIADGTELKDVASWHHQVLNPQRLGQGLTVTAMGPDNVIEAVEYQANRFSLGVQFHPEADAMESETYMSFFETLVDYASDKPVIGITWKSTEQDYASFKTVIEAAGGIPVELGQVTSTAVGYDESGAVQSEYLATTGMLKQEYADVVKSKDFSKSNVAQVMSSVDGVFFTGGEDISPSLFAVPQVEDNEGEAINSTRDISDYTLMAYCIANDVPTFAACRGMQMMSIVSGADFIQDIPNYYAAAGKTYSDEHRMPADAPNRTYARHDVDVFATGSKWMYDIVGSTELKNVSSWHHQAVKSVEGTNLTVVAKTTVDGIDIIEGVENQNNTFCLGVQFHPENDCQLALHQGKPELALCDLDVCLKFFQTLVEYAGQ